MGVGILVLLIALTCCQPTDHSATLKPALDQVVNAWNTGVTDGLENVMHTDLVRHAPPSSNSDVNSLDSLKSVVASFHQSFPDLELVIDEEDYMENEAVVRWTFSGTNTGPGAFPATGNAVNISGISLIKFVDGKIKEEYVSFDNMDFMGQLGYRAVSPTASLGDDPTVVDPAHYKVDFENERVRVLRINYKPGETSVMHDHPDGVVVYLTDAQGQFTLPDGSVVDAGGKRGQALWAPGGLHLPANVGRNAFEVILVELK